TPCRTSSGSPAPIGASGRSTPCSPMRSNSLRSPPAVAPPVDRGRLEARNPPMTQPRTLTPIFGAAAWKGAELGRSEEWIYPRSPAEQAEIERLVQALRRTGKPRESITRDDVQLGELAAAVRAWRETLAHGRGFVLIRGVPIERMSETDVVLAYWALGLHL